MTFIKHLNLTNHPKYNLKQTVQRAFVPCFQDNGDTVSLSSKTIRVQQQPNFELKSYCEQLKELKTEHISTCKTINSLEKMVAETTEKRDTLKAFLQYLEEKILNMKKGDFRPFQPAEPLADYCDLEALGRIRIAERAMQKTKRPIPLAKKLFAEDKENLIDLDIKLRIAKQQLAEQKIKCEEISNKLSTYK